VLSACGNIFFGGALRSWTYRIFAAISCLFLRQKLAQKSELLFGGLTSADSSANTDFVSTNTFPATSCVPPRPPGRRQSVATTPGTPFLARGPEAWSRWGRVDSVMNWCCALHNRACDSLLILPPRGKFGAGMIQPFRGVTTAQTNTPVEYSVVSCQ